MKMRASEVLNFVSGLFVRLMPQKVAELLAVEETRAGVLSRNEASDVLRSAFQNTEEALDFQYEVRFISTYILFLICRDVQRAIVLGRSSNTPMYPRQDNYLNRVFKHL